MTTPAINDALRELRKERHRAMRDGAPDRAALLHLLIIVEELSATVGELHERVTRLERRGA